jgi:hypothetical protein
MFSHIITPSFPEIGQIVRMLCALEVLTLNGCRVRTLCPMGSINELNHRNVCLRLHTNETAVEVERLD